MEQGTARILKPERSLLTYYMLRSLLTGPGFVIAAPISYFRYRSLRYEVDDEGITMRWGILFRREISLTYARIQDIQLSSNVVERWLDLARIDLQTASGSSSAEMTIEGLRDVEPFRDYLYSRMRGVAHGGAPAGETMPATGAIPTLAHTDDTAGPGDLTATLNAVADEVRALRLALQEQAGRTGGGRAR